MAEFSKKLRSRNIALHFDRDWSGKIQTVYFIDNRNKATYTNHELKVPLTDILQLQAPPLSKQQKLPQSFSGGKKRHKPAYRPGHSLYHFGTFSTVGMIDILLRPEYGGGGSAGTSPKKKKRRRGPHL